MSRRRRILVSTLVGLLTLALVLGVSGFLVVRSDWFREMVRDRLVTTVEEASGGRVEIGEFRFDWKQMEATVKPFVVHGTEPAGEAPLLTADSVQVGLKVVSALKRDVDIQYLVVDRPRLNLLVDKNGRTNIPEPKLKKPKSGKDPVEEILDLAVRRFEVRNGTLRYAQRSIPLEIRGQDLNARFNYDITGPRYTGTVAMNQVNVSSGANKTLQFTLDSALVAEKGRLEITHAKVATAQSNLSLKGAVVDLNHPQATFQVNGGLNVAEFGPLLQLGPSPKGAVNVEAQGTYNDAGLTVNTRMAGYHLSLQQSGISLTGDASAEGRITLNPAGEYAVNARLAGNQLTIRQDGTVVTTRGMSLKGEGSLQNNNQYAASARLEAKEIGLRQGTLRLDHARLSTDLQLTPQALQLRNVSLSALGGGFQGDVRLTSGDRFAIKGTVHGLSLTTLAQTQGLKNLAYAGTLSGPVEVQGRLAKGSPALQANAQLTIAPAAGAVPLQGSLDVFYDQTTGALRLGNSVLATPNSRVQLSGTLGQSVTVQAESRNLQDLLPAIALATGKPPEPLPVELRNGVVRLNATVAGSLKAPQITGHLTADRFALQGQTFDQFSSDFEASQAGARLRNMQLTQGGLRVNAQGELALRDWKPLDASPLSATVRIQNAQLSQVLAENGLKVPVDGVLNATVQLKGTFGTPQGDVQATVDRLVAYDEQFDRLEAQAHYSPGRFDVNNAVLRLGSARLTLTGRYLHRPNDLKNGNVTFQLASNGFNLSQFKTLQKAQQGLSGQFNLEAAGSLAVRNAEPLLNDLNGEIAVRSLAVQNTALGNVVVNAQTKGEQLTLQAQGDLRGTTLQGNAQVALTGDYQGQGKVQVSTLTLSRFRDLMALLGQPNADLPVDASVNGTITFSGPLRDPDRLTARLELPLLEIRPVQQVRTRLPLQDLALRNVEPVVVEVTGKTVQIRSAKLQGRDTNLQASGQLSLDQKGQWDLRINGDLNLAILENFQRDLRAAGRSTLNATVRGTLAQPSVLGRLELKDASLSAGDLPATIENANGVVVFDRNRATIESLTAGVGGGNVRLTGFVGFGGQEMIYRLQATADRVRYRQEGVSVTSDASLSLTGTTSRSLLSGNITVRKAGFNQQTDFGGLLATSAKAVPSTNPSEFLRNMQLDVRVESVPNLQFTTSLTSNIQAEVDLRIKGNAEKPVVLGRVLVNQGEVNFFGTKYEINRGEISFFNPVKIEPVLDLDLQTVARGTTVTINFSGPLSKINVSYRSDPPLQSSEIIALLTVGRDPGTNPALASSQTVSQNSLVASGTNSLIGAAVASPISNRLQRFFGVSRLKIDPQLTGLDNTPQARVTIEQQVSRDITVTFITNLTRSQQQIIRVQYDINRNFSLLAIRDENGVFGIDLQYRKRFR